MKFAHACGEVVAEYIGPEPLLPGQLIRNAEWLIAGQQYGPLSGMTFRCPYCNEDYVLGPRDLKQVQEAVH